MAPSDPNLSVTITSGAPPTAEQLASELATDVLVEAAGHRIDRAILEVALEEALTRRGIA